jgi:hypothetical protein
MAIEVVAITGDNNATVGVNGKGTGSNLAPSVGLSGLTAGSSEIFVGSAENGTSTYPTWNAMSGFTQVGTTQNISGPTGFTTFNFSSAVYFGPSVATATGSITSSGSTHNWGTIGIEIIP